MSAPFYSYDPCVYNGKPCGACQHSVKPGALPRNDLGPCSVYPGGGCSPCPAPVRPCPEPCPPEPLLPCLPPCPPCERPNIPAVPCQPCDSVAIPCSQPRRCIPCPCCCPKPVPSCFSANRCVYPGVPVYGFGCCGPCMPVW